MVDRYGRRMAAAWGAIGVMTAISIAFFFYLGLKIDGLGARIEALLAAQTARIDAQGARLDAQTALGARLDGRLDVVAAQLEAQTVIATGVVAVVPLPAGTVNIALVADDGLLQATNLVTVQILTPAQAVESLLTAVSAGLPRSHPLLATLQAPLAAIKRGNAGTAANQLQAFQNKVRAQVLPQDTRSGGDAYPPGTGDY